VVVFAGLAEFAFAAGAAWIQGDTITDLDPRDLGAYGFDGAGDFMAEDDGLPDAYDAESAVQVVVQVGATDATGANAHQDLVFLHLGNRNRFDAQILFGM
jgi:hypothetical protein